MRWSSETVRARRACPMPDVGSSRSRSRGPVMRAAISPNHCRCACESSAAIAPGSRSESASTSRTDADVERPLPERPGRRRAASCASARCSPTVRCSRTRPPCSTIPMPNRTRSRDTRPLISRPSNRMAPASGEVRPIRTSSRVDFPAPLGPTSPTRSPTHTSRSKPSSALIEPRSTATPRTVRRGALAIIGWLAVGCDGGSRHPQRGRGPPDRRARRTALAAGR